ncbi:response regulator transcription factor [Paraburkholderia acidipaludis]|uniref:response regulator transcription factor n=1 Tax=Paraburkholderia acidipaludis TaxID=660537 RepID=UPI0004816934|nr:response regulator transcription factor [Paraburkholderia acidipaludis]
MRVLLTATADTTRHYMQKALTESLNSVEATDDLFYASHLARIEEFDAIVVCRQSEEDLDTLFEVLADLRHIDNAPAIVMALGRATPAECARLLRAGADACYVQPYSVLEIHERIHALRRNAAYAAAQTQTDMPTLRLDPMTREAVDGELRIPLTTREFLLIECLLRRPNAPVAREQLTRYAWPEREDVEPSSVNLVVSRLRRKLKASGAHFRLDTVNRYGYQLTTVPDLSSA